MSEAPPSGNLPLDELDPSIGSHDGVHPLLRPEDFIDKPKALDTGPGMEQVEPSGNFSKISFTEEGKLKRGRTYEVGEDGKKTPISRKAYEEKYLTQSDNTSKDPEKPAQAEHDKPEPEKQSAADKQKVMVEDWARHEYNGNKEGAKEAQDAIQEYLIDAVKRGVMTDDEAVAQIDRLWQLKEANKAERQKLLDDLGQRLQGRLDELNGGSQTGGSGEGDDGGDLSPPLTDEELEKGFLDQIKLPEGLSEKLDSAREAYIKASVNRRGRILRGNKELERARTEYERLRNQAGEKIAKGMLDAGFTKEEIAKWSKRGAQYELHQIARGIKAEQEASFDGKRFKGVYEWWGRRGALKKAGATIAVGAAVGFGLRAANILPGGIAGAAILGGAMGLARGHLNRVSRMKSDAKAQASALMNEADRRYGDSSLDYTHVVGTEAVGNATDTHTRGIVASENKELLKSGVIGAGAAAGGALAADAVGNLFGGNVSAGPDAPGDIIPPSDGIPAPEVPTPDIVPETPIPDADLPTPDAPDAGVEAPIPDVDFSGYNTPFSWAEANLEGNPMDRLRELGDMAAADGHNVEWITESDGDRILKIDGRQQTGHVLNILSQYLGNTTPQLPMTS